MIKHVGRANFSFSYKRYFFLTFCDWVVIFNESTRRYYFYLNICPISIRINRFNENIILSVNGEWLKIWYTHAWTIFIWMNINLPENTENKLNLWNCSVWLLVLIPKNFLLWQFASSGSLGAIGITHFPLVVLSGYILISWSLVVHLTWPFGYVYIFK